MKCNSEVHLQNKDKVFFFFFNLANLEQYIGSTLSTNFFPKDIEFVRPTAYFLNSGMHHKENLLSLVSFFTRGIWKTQACISVSSKSLL